MKFTTVFCLIFLPIQILFAQGDSLLINLSPRAWYELPNSKMRTKCPDEPEEIFQGTCDCACVISTWSGGTYNSIHDKLIIWGGGHNDYYGNELYAFDISNLCWELLTEPSDPALPGSCVEVLEDGRPNARHTYGGLSYIAHADRLFAHGGSLACLNGNSSKKTWTFDFNTATWYDMNPSGDKPTYDILDEYSIYDPVSQLVFIFWHSEMFSYDYNQNNWTYLDANQISYLALGCTIDTKRGLLVEVGNLRKGRVAVHDIRNNDYTRQIWTTTGNTNIVSAYAPGLAYDPIADRVVGWKDGAIYSLNMDTKVWEEINAPGAPSPTQKGMFGRFRYIPKYNVFIAVTSVDENVHFYKNTLGKNGTEGYEQRGAGNMLNFNGWDGINGEYINIGSTSQLNIAGDLTIEAWLYISSPPAADNYYGIVTHGNHRAGTEVEADNQLYGLDIISDSEVRFSHEYNAGQNETQVATVGMLPGNWVHLAFVRNTSNSTFLFMVNGLVKSNLGYTNTPSGGNSGILVLGGGFGDSGTPSIPIDTGYLNGQMDEVRIWNAVVDYETIQNWMNRKVTSNHPYYTNLKGYWRLDELSPSIVAIDQTDNNIGILTNMESIDDRMTSIAPIGNASTYAVKSTPQTDPNLIRTPEVPIDVTFGSDLDDPGLNYPLAAIQVNEAPNNTSGLLTNSPDTYWELWARDKIFDGDFTAIVRFHYDYIDGIGNEANLNLFRRDDATSNWSYIPAILNDRDNNTDGIGYLEITITETTIGGFSGQYIISSTDADNPLPVELLTFTASLVDDDIKLEWVTFSEVKNQGFEIWRAIDYDEKFQMISSYENNSELIGRGNSNATTYYHYLDKNIVWGHEYHYQLWDVSYSGERNCHGPISISAGNKDNIIEKYILHQNYPNPFNSTTEIPFTLPEPCHVSLTILNVLGEEIWIMSDSYYEAGYHSKRWNGLDRHGIPVPSGVYLYRLSAGSLTGEAGDYVESKKMVLMR